MNITIIGNYPPRSCGISTFTENLVRALQANFTKNDNDRLEVIAMNDPDAEYPYPAVVTGTIPQNDIEAYRATARRINASDTDVVILQHEYGIFGGERGTHILELVKLLKKPLTVTFHTVLDKPDFLQKQIMQDICEKAQKAVVMSEKAVEFLQKIYKVPAAKIVEIEHGVPDCVTDSREKLREKFGFGDKKIMMTFGLLGRGKGIQTGVKALVEIAKTHPNIEYWVLGKTHPHVIKHEGEAYRDELTAIAKAGGVADKLKYVNEFIDENLLCDYLRAADIYVLPYPNEAQITSGTLSYAVGAGAAVVSTPFWHATELLAKGRGRFFDFSNPTDLAAQVNDLLNNPQELHKLRYNACEYGATLSWKKKGADYLETFREAIDNFSAEEEETEKQTDMKLPALNSRHLRLLTDKTGIIQHAKYGFPNFEEGYCTDDNGRALIAVSAFYEENQDPKYLELLSIYMAYLHYMQRDDGKFRNFLSFDRRFLDEEGSQDSFARAVWGLGNLQVKDVPAGYRHAAQEMFDKAFSTFDKVHHLRAVAYLILGSADYLVAHPDAKDKREKIKSMADMLCKNFDKHSTEADWQWFDSHLTYANALLPASLFAASRLFDKDEKYLKTAKKAMSFLEEVTLSGGHFTPVGCHGFYTKGDECPRFDQQPIDATKSVIMYLHAYEATQNATYLDKAKLCFEWFTGKNDLGLSLYNERNGGCYDGLTAHGVNQNQGAESTLAFWIARAAIKNYNEDFSETKKRNESGNTPSTIPVGLLKNKKKKSPAAKKPEPMMQVHKKPAKTYPTVAPVYQKTHLSFSFYRKD